MDNLPPGVRESDIPGNTPEDALWESMVERLSVSGLSPGEIIRRVESPHWSRGKKIPNSKRIWP